MSTKLPPKTTTRQGRFKKKLVSESFLEKEAPVILDKLTPIIQSLEKGQISGAEFTAIYILIVLAYRYPGAWLGAKKNQPLKMHHHLNYSFENCGVIFEPNIQKRLSSFKDIGDIYNHFSLKSTPEAVNQAILSWSMNEYKLELMFYIPRPKEVLSQQKKGHRCVTVITKKEKASKYILAERDALSFTMHDLIHADHFYRDNECFKGQIGFYGFLDHCMNEGHFEEHLKCKDFVFEFEYLISDMNAYAIHLLKCFKSALIHYMQNGELFFGSWVKKIGATEAEVMALLQLNSPMYDPYVQDQLLLNFLSKYEK